MQYGFGNNKRCDSRTYSLNNGWSRSGALHTAVSHTSAHIIVYFRTWCCLCRYAYGSTVVFPLFADFPQDRRIQAHTWSNRRHYCHHFWRFYVQAQCDKRPTEKQGQPQFAVAGLHFGSRAYSLQLHRCNDLYFCVFCHVQCRSRQWCIRQQRTDYRHINNAWIRTRVVYMVDIPHHVAKFPTQKNPSTSSSHHQPNWRFNNYPAGNIHYHLNLCGNNISNIHNDTHYWVSRHIGWCYAIKISYQ